MSSPAIFIKSFHVRITIGTKQFHYTLLPFPLNDDFTVFHGTAYAALRLQYPPQFFQVGLCTDESFHHGDHFSTAILAFDTHSQFLSVFGSVSASFSSPLSNAKSGLVEYTIPNLDFQSLSFADMAQSSVSFR